MGDDTQPTPEGFKEVFLSMTTQQKFDLKTDDDVTEEDPDKLVPKQDIIDDLKFRAKFCDFHPIKDVIEKYMGESLLLVWDPDGIYGGNFIVATTEGTKTKWLEEKAAKRPKTSESKAEQEGEAELGPRPEAVSKPWVSQGSEAEIDEANVQQGRDAFVLGITRKRREFGALYKFGDRDAQDHYIECRGFKDPNFELRRTALDAGTQVTAATHNQAAQTTWFRAINRIMQYTPQDMEAPQKRQQLSSKDMVSFLRNVSGRYEEALQQNETIDIFQDDFSSLGEDEASVNTAENDMKEVQYFNHVQFCASRMASSVDWRPHSRDVMAVSCAARLSFSDRVGQGGKVQIGLILIWNFSDPINPQFVLEAPGDVLAFKHNPSNPDIIVAGTISGQVVMWRITEAREQLMHKKKEMEELKQIKAMMGEDADILTTQVVKPAYTSSISESHAKGISDLQWLPSTLEISPGGKIFANDGGEINQFTTLAGDHKVLFWDIRIKGDPKQKSALEVVWTPTFKLDLEWEGTGKVSASHSSMADEGEDRELDSFFCVSEDGEFLQVGVGNNVPKDGEEGPANGVLALAHGHVCPCVSLHRSTFDKSILVSAGDWTFNIWKEGVEKPIFTSPFASCTLTAARWSPSRPAVVFVGRSDGSVDVWDLADRSHEPSMTFNISSFSITCMEFKNFQTHQLLAVGDDQATVHIMEVPRNLRRAVPNEKHFMSTFCEREVRRVRYVQARMEVRQEEYEEAQRLVETEQTEEDKEKEEKDAREAEMKAEEAYRHMEHEFKIEMGLIQEKEDDE